MKNKEAKEIEKRITLQKKREKDSIIDELVRGRCPVICLQISHNFTFE